MCDLGHEQRDDFGFLVDTPAIRSLIFETRRLTEDIDDTALSSYACLKAANFERRPAGGRCARRARMPAIRQVLRLYRFARRRGVAVFFITGRRGSRP